MITRKLISLSLSFIILISLCCGCSNQDVQTNIDEGSAELIETKSWVDSIGNTYYAQFYTNGTTAKKALEESNDVTLNHIFIDDIPVYEMFSSKKNTGKMLFLFHGQNSRKEEYLFDMIRYAEAGYFCVAVDLVGHGERLTSEAKMSVQITVETAKDIDVLLEYYKTIPQANSDVFALLGLSQGGSVSYWYAAYGKNNPTALVVGSSTPDYNYQNDTEAIQNGETIDAIWSDSELQSYVSKNNPINNLDKFIGIPTLSGNGLKDTVISYKGSEELEKAKFEAGYTNSQFFYFENVGHEVTEDFMMRVIGFLNNHL